MARLALFGQVGEFNPNKEKIWTYLEIVKLFLETNSADDERKATVLLTIIGAKN